MFQSTQSVIKILKELKICENILNFLNIHINSTAQFRIHIGKGPSGDLAFNGSRGCVQATLFGNSIKYHYYYHY